MTTKKKRVLLSVLGVLTGLAVWPAAELLISYQHAFPAYAVYFTVLGGMSGLVAGGFFGSVDGILAVDFQKGLAGVLAGAFWGLVSGLLGFLAGQLFLGFFLRFLAEPDTVPPAALMAAVRGGSWALFGLLLSLMEGVRRRSLHLILVGALGGLVGGLLGGAALPGLQWVFPGMIAARMAGFLLLFLLLGFFYSFFEWKLSWGVLCLLNGPRKGREYLVNQKRIRIGSDDFSDIVLQGYGGVRPEHANLAVRDGSLWIERMDDEASVLVNEEPAEEQELKYEDVIHLGKARFFLKVE